MTIDFPKMDEIPLDSPPLIEVVCQVRIPPILQIATELPTAFQEQVRQRFPQLEIEQGIEVALAPLMKDAELLAQARPKIYRFKSPDSESSISLAADFYAVSTTQYRHWHEFASDLQFAHDAMVKVYSPPFATRIGLRYINKLTHINTGTTTSQELLNLLNPQLTSLLNGEVGNNVAEMVCRLAFIEEPAQLNLQFSFDGQSRVVVLDLDYFEKGTISIDGLIERGSSYHNVVYNAFRWCVRDSTLDRFNVKVRE